MRGVLLFSSTLVLTLCLVKNLCLLKNFGEFLEHFDLLWSSLTTKVKHSNPTDGSHMSDFLVNLEQYQKDLSLIGCLLLPFDSATIMTITCFVASVVAKIYRLRTEKLGELEAPWIAK